MAAARNAWSASNGWRGGLLSMLVRVNNEIDGNTHIQNCMVVGIDCDYASSCEMVVAIGSAS